MVEIDERSLQIVTTANTLSQALQLGSTEVMADSLAQLTSLKLTVEEARMPDVAQCLASMNAAMIGQEFFLPSMGIEFTVDNSPDN